jgi:outer membrane biogenesis lipoprotein LolB
MLALRWMLVASLLLGGCSIPGHQPAALSARTDCDRADAVWREALGFCEYTSGCR